MISLIWRVAPGIPRLLASNGTSGTCTCYNQQSFLCSFVLLNEPDPESSQSSTPISVLCCLLAQIICEKA